MTITSQDLADYSPFRVSEQDAGTDPTAITTVQFLKYAAMVKKKLDRDNPGLATEEYDHAQALLIAHTIVAKDGGLERKLERNDGFSIEKEPGKTSFLVQYELLIAEACTEMQKGTRLIAHTDTESKALDLDQTRSPELFDENSSDELETAKDPGTRAGRNDDGWL